MKIPKALVVSLLLALVIPGLPVPAVAGQGEALGEAKLRNPDFEEAPSSTDSIPGWSRCFGTGAELAPGEGVDHSTAVRFKDHSQSAAVGLCSSSLAVTPGETYVLTASLKSTSGSPTMMIRFSDADGEVIDSPSQYWNLRNPRWETVSLQAKVPSGAVSAHVLLYSSGYNTGEFLWDEVTFQKTTPKWEAQPLASPVRNVSSMRGAIVSKHPETGRSYSVIPLVGEKSAVAVVDLISGESRQAPLPGIQGAWGAVATADGDVYIGGWSAGRLLRVNPVTMEVVDLGIPVPSDSFIWDLAEAPDGKIYGGTYPSGSVFSYDPSTGVVKDFGTMMPGMEYARSVAAGPDGTIYVGLGQTHPTVMALNPATGERWTIPLPEPYASEPGKAYDVSFEGGRLFVRVENSSTLLVTKDFESWESLGKAVGLLVSPPDNDGKHIYFTSLESRRLMAYDLRTDDVLDTGIDQPAGVRAFEWVDLPTNDAGEMPTRQLAMTTFNASTVLFDIPAKMARTVEAKVPGVPLVLSVIGEGPDGNIYASGMQAGGLSAVDPKTGEVRRIYAAVAQAEHLVTVKEKLFLGTYTGAQLSVFDPGSEVSESNPRAYASLQKYGQDRPLAAAVNGTLLAVGSVPDYGRHDGGIALVDTNSFSHTFMLPVPDQSVLALDAIGEGFVGGTGIYGGLGAQPKAKDAELFFVGPDGDLEWSGVPLPGEKAITAVRTASDGTVWGVTAGKLFQFDPVKKEVLRVTTLEPVNWDAVKSLWSSGSIELLADGRMIVVARGKVFEVDPRTLSRQEIASGARHLIQTKAGELFFARGDTVMHLEPLGREKEESATSPDRWAPESGSGEIVSDAGRQGDSNEMIQPGLLSTGK